MASTAFTTMKTDSKIVSPATSRDAAAIDDEAADWLARRDAGFAPGEAAEFNRWLKADPRHAAAVAVIESAWLAINRPRQSGVAHTVLKELDRRARVRRWRRLALTASTAGLAAAAAFVFAFLPRSPSPARDPHTPTAAVATALRPAQQLLADGSMVELNAIAEISVDFSSTRRRVKLLRGEAHFSVSKDTARPFVVTAGPVEVRAVGTQFAVGLAPEKVEVLVNEGRVAIERIVAPASSPNPYTLPAEPASLFAAAGARVEVLFGQAPEQSPLVTQLTPDELERELAWRRKRVEFTGTPLGEAVVLFNRQNRVQLSLDDDALSALRVSGIYWTDNPEGFARLVEASFGLRAQRVSDESIVLGK